MFLRLPSVQHVLVILGHEGKWRRPGLPARDINIFLLAEKPSFTFAAPQENPLSYQWFKLKSRISSLVSNEVNSLVIFFVGSRAKAIGAILSKICGPRPIPLFTIVLLFKNDTASLIFFPFTSIGLLVSIEYFRFSLKKNYSIFLNDCRSHGDLPDAYRLWSQTLLPGAYRLLGWPCLLNRFCRNSIRPL